MVKFSDDYGIFSINFGGDHANCGIIATSMGIMAVTRLIWRQTTSQAAELKHALQANTSSLQAGYRSVPGRFPAGYQPEAGQRQERQASHYCQQRIKQVTS